MSFRFLLVSLVFIACFPALALAVDNCELAADIALQAKQTFTTNPAGGLNQYIQAQQLCPSEPAYGYNLGMAYYRLGRKSEAVTWLGNAVTAEPENPVWRNNLAWAQMELGQLNAAQLNAQVALALAPQDSRIQDTMNKIRAISRSR